MNKKNSQKIKLVKLLEILRQQTDVEHQITTSRLVEQLSGEGISCDRRTLARDIDTLNEYGYEIMFCMRGHQKSYYVDDRSFSVPELKILIDAVQAASFITEKKTAQLTEKIALLGGSHRAEILKGNMIKFNARKHKNESIYYNVNYIEEAICGGRQISYQYFDLDTNGKRVYRHNGERYRVEPIALVFNEDNYYLICYSAPHGQIINYRIDRMESVMTERERVSAKARLNSREITDCTEQMFKMYGGEKTNATLSFDKTLLNAVYDKFGEKTKVTDMKDGTCVIRVTIQVSPTFWGWIFQFAGKMKIIEPQKLDEEYKNRCYQVFSATETKI